MGYLVVAHLLKAKPDIEPLRSLPPSIAWALYRDDAAKAFYLDTYRAGRPQDTPFTSMPATKDLPLDLPESLSVLTKGHAALVTTGLANSFHRGLIQLNLRLSELLRQPVLTVCSNDEEYDFTCQSHGGQLERLRCRCTDIELEFQDNRVTIQPLLIEDEEGDATELSDLGDWDASADITVLPRDKPYAGELHAVAAAEATKFLGVPRAPLGLGSFDGMPKPPKRIAGHDPANPSSEKPRKPWWKFWA